MCVLPYLEKNSRQTDVSYRHDPSFLESLAMLPQTIAHDRIQAKIGA